MSNLIHVNIESTLTEEYFPAFFEKSFLLPKQVLLSGWIKSPFIADKAAFEYKLKEYFFVNGRPCLCPSGLAKKLTQIYKEDFGVLVKPFFILFLTISSELVDVNFTPDKRFLSITNESFLFDILVKELKNILFSSPCPVTSTNSSLLLSSQSVETIQLKQKIIPFPSTANTSLSSFIVPPNLKTVTNTTEHISPDDPLPVENSDKITGIANEPCNNNISLTSDRKSTDIEKADMSHILNAESPFIKKLDPSLKFIKNLASDHICHTSLSSFVCDAEIVQVLSKEDFLRMKVVGQFNHGFILCHLLNSSNEKLLYIFDQHACDEKYNYEKMKSSLTNSSSVSHQKLLRLQLFNLIYDLAQSS